MTKRKETATQTQEVNVSRYQLISVIFFMVWLIFGLYVGLAGWTKVDMDILKEQAKSVSCDPSDPNSSIEYNGETFCSLEDMLHKRKSESRESNRDDQRNTRNKLN